MNQPNITLTIQLEQLIAHKRVGSGDPYLWTIFFKVDDSCLRVNDAFRLEGAPELRFTDHGCDSLGKVPLKQRRTAIPPHLGTWETMLKPLRVPYFEQTTVGLAGVVYIVLIHNNLSQEGAVAAHIALNKLVQRAVLRVVNGFDPTKIELIRFTKSIGAYFGDAFKKELADVQNIIVDAVKNNQSLVQNLWTLVHKDELIGYDFNIFTHFDFEDEPTTPVEFGNRFKTEHGDFEVQGSVRFH